MLKKLKPISNVFFMLIALLTLVDYTLTGRQEIEPVIALNNSFESYYNARGNSHYSKKIETENFNFSISEKYYELINIGDEIAIEESPLFKEINASKSIKKNYTETYSLRRLTGLIIPLLLLIAIGINYKFKDKTTVLLVISKLIIVINLVYLLM